MTAKRKKSTLPDWRVQSLRLTVFHNQLEVSSEKWWDEITNGLQHAINKDKIGQTTIEGQIDGDTFLNMRLSPLRIDLNFGIDRASPLEVSAEKPPFFKTIGTLDDTLKKFEPYVLKLLKSKKIPTITRLAFGANLIFNAKNRDQGYSMMIASLPVSLDKKKISDFRFQVNIPTESKVQSKSKVNRVTKWSVLKLDAELSENALSSKVKYPSIYANVLELDISTDKDSKETINRTKSIKIFKELVEFGRDISSKGLTEYE